MHSSDGRLTFAATDLSKFLACSHLSLLDRRTALGGPRPRKFEDPKLDVLRRRGQDHERAYLEGLQARPGIQVADLRGPYPGDSDQWDRLSDRTSEAMAAGVDVIYQGALFDGAWTGLPDFLSRVEKPSRFGAWSYEVVDTKLTREAKGGAVLQISLYCDLLEQVQGAAPEHMHLALGGPEARTETLRAADFAAYYRAVKTDITALMATADGSPPAGPDPVEHCQICDWRYQCDRERREADHLSLVAGISRKQRRSLVERGVHTLTSLAELALPVEPPLEGVSRAATERIREQARIQMKGRNLGSPCYELLHPPVEEEGLLALPEPSQGDLFFDIEGDQYAFTDGIEYLFGYANRDAEYTGLWAFSRDEEKARFEEFIDFVVTRFAEDPALHIYHYAPYEPTALKKLTGRDATREAEVDMLLRGKVFVDLYRVVKQALRASVESYSIKKLEPLYGYERDVDLRSADDALACFEAWLELDERREGAKEFLDDIEGYNRDDCVSTLRLRDWLETLRPQLEKECGSPLLRPAPAEAKPSEDLVRELELVAALQTQLTEDVAAEPEDSTEQQARWLLSQMLVWHRREKKSMWWEYFRCLGLSREELIEDRSTLGGLTYEGIVGTVKQSNVHRYRFPHQEHDIRLGSRPKDPETENHAGKVEGIDEAAGTIDLKRGIRSGAPHPDSLIPYNDVPDGVLRDSLFRVGEAVAQRGLGDQTTFRSATDLLLANPPRVDQPEGQGLQQEGETTLEAACRLVHLLDRTALPIQGPPGSGKTFTGARMILDLLKAGKSVGITATSHQVVGGLLEATCKAAREAGFPIEGVQRAGDDQACPATEITTVASYSEVHQALDTGVHLLAGTAWLWAREDMVGSVDVLFIDEAGQFSLANALAVSPAAESMVLLGDPQQLDQPQTGVHPPGADASVLDHLLRHQPTVSPEQGLFLAETWRLHPKLCAFTSEIFYRGRLRSRPGLEKQTIVGPVPFNGSGLRLVHVAHSGNQNESQEEVREVNRLVRLLLASAATWTDRDGTEETVRDDDVLVVAPYNAQVSALAASLPQGIRVGTVDKFQGKEAPVVIYSMATSSVDDAPRGMSFLFNGNRLNVATSRAKCLAVVVASPELFGPECKSPRQMRLANAFCRYEEMVESDSNSWSG